ncbi:hypothetical protein GCM10028832_27460 [Streptomyces sparsus]
MTAAPREAQPAHSQPDVPHASYASYDCRPGSHAACAEAVPRSVPTPGVSYQVCRCACHRERPPVA